ncbi:MAG TPA: S8 family serine peptidase [Chthonomonadaceae bacterium]|nr:S8 family serine peptidase [Chthonomonadaceae bacterium]
MRFRMTLTWMLAGMIFMAARIAQADGVVPGYVLVQLKAGADIESLESEYDTTTEEHVEDLSLYSLTTPSGSTEAEFAQQLNKDSRVVWAQTDTYVASPEFSGTAFHFAFDAGPDPGAYVNQTAYQQVNLAQALKSSTGSGIVVAVLDTGATFSHPALQGHYVGGYNVLNPFLPPDDVADGVTNEAVGHGTMIAGIIARGAPKAQILPVRVLNGDGFGTALDVAIGIDYAVTHGARVLNMSFGSSQNSRALEEALSEAIDAGAVVVASAGNDNTSKNHYPAASPDVLAVTSVESNNVKSSYANFGAYVTVVAPGSGIRSTYYTGGYANWSGTSFATPFITAEVALIFSRHPKLTTSQIEEMVCATAHSVDNFNPRYQEQLGDGIIDMAAAVKCAPPSN